MESHGDVDICVTCISHKPPQLPLREELPSLGVEVVYRAQGTGAQAVREGTQRKLHTFRERELEKEKSGCPPLIPKSQKAKRRKREKRERIERELCTLKSLSYDEYLDYLYTDQRSSSPAPNLSLPDDVQSSADVAHQKRRQKVSKPEEESRHEEPALGKVSGRDTDSAPVDGAVFAASTVFAQSDEFVALSNERSRRDSDSAGVAKEKWGREEVLKPGADSRLQDPKLRNASHRDANVARVDGAVLAASAVFAGSDKSAALNDTSLFDDLDSVDISHEKGGDEEISIPEEDSRHEKPELEHASHRETDIARVDDAVLAASTVFAQSDKSVALNDPVMTNKATSGTSPGVATSSFHESASQQAINDAFAAFEGKPVIIPEVTKSQDFSSSEPVVFPDTSASQNWSGGVYVLPRAVIETTPRGSTETTVPSADQSKSPTFVDESRVLDSSIDSEGVVPEKSSFDTTPASHHRSVEAQENSQCDLGVPDNRVYSSTSHTVPPATAFKHEAMDTVLNYAISSESSSVGSWSDPSRSESVPKTEDHSQEDQPKEKERPVEDKGWVASALKSITANMYGGKDKTDKSQEKERDAQRKFIAKQNAIARSTLFSVLTRPNPDPREVQMIVQLNPDVVSTSSENDGRLPLHIACDRVLPHRNVENKASLFKDLKKDITNHLELLAVLSSENVNASMVPDASGDLPVHLLARRLIKWETDWETELSSQHTEKTASSAVVTEIIHTTTACVEIALKPVVSTRCLCRARGSEGRILPLHVASWFKVSTRSFRDLLESYPEAASVPCDLNGLASAEVNGCLPIELFERATGLHAKTTARSGDYDVRSDLLFSFNPNVLPFRREKDRIERMETMVRDTAMSLSNEEKELNPAAHSVWFWFCTFDDGFDDDDNYVEVVMRIVDSLDSIVVRELAMTKSEDGTLLLDVARPECVEIIKARIGQGVKQNKDAFSIPESKSNEMISLQGTVSKDQREPQAEILEDSPSVASAEPEAFHGREQPSSDKDELDFVSSKAYSSLEDPQERTNVDHTEASEETSAHQDNVSLESESTAEDKSSGQTQPGVRKFYDESDFHPDSLSLGSSSTAEQRLRERIQSRSIVSSDEEFHPDSFSVESKEDQSSGHTLLETIEGVSSAAVTKTSGERLSDSDSQFSMGEASSDAGLSISTEKSDGIGLNVRISNSPKGLFRTEQSQPDGREMAEALTPEAEEKVDVGVLCKTIFNIKEESFPASFVIMPYKLKKGPGGALMLESPESANVAMKFAQCLLRITEPWNIFHVLEKKSVEHLGHKVSTEHLPTWRDTEEKNENLELVLLSLYHATKGYIYFLDEHNGVPMVTPSLGTNESYPIEIEDPADVVKRLLPLMLMGMVRMRGERALAVLAKTILQGSEYDAPPGWIRASYDIITTVHAQERLCDESLTSTTSELLSLSEELNEYISRVARSNNPRRPESKTGCEWIVELSYMKSLLEEVGSRRKYAGLSPIKKKHRTVLWTAQKVDRNSQRRQGSIENPRTEDDTQRIGQDDDSSLSGESDISSTTTVPKDHVSSLDPLEPQMFEDDMDMVAGGGKLAAVIEDANEDDSVGSNEEGSCVGEETNGDTDTYGVTSNGDTTGSRSTVVLENERELRESLFETVKDELPLGVTSSKSESSSQATENISSGPEGGRKANVSLAHFLESNSSNLESKRQVARGEKVQLPEEIAHAWNQLDDGALESSGEVAPEALKVQPLSAVASTLVAPSVEPRTTVPNQYKSGSPSSERRAVKQSEPESNTSSSEETGVERNPRFGVANLSSIMEESCSSEDTSTEARGSIGDEINQDSSEVNGADDIPEVQLSKSQDEVEDESIKSDEREPTYEEEYSSGWNIGDTTDGEDSGYLSMASSATGNQDMRLGRDTNSVASSESGTDNGYTSDSSKNSIKSSSKRPPRIPARSIENVKACRPAGEGSSTASSSTLSVQRTPDPILDDKWTSNNLSNSQPQFHSDSSGKDGDVSNLSESQDPSSIGESFHIESETNVRASTTIATRDLHDPKREEVSDTTSTELSNVSVSDVADESSYAYSTAEGEQESVISLSKSPTVVHSNAHSSEPSSCTTTEHQSEEESSCMNLQDYIEQGNPDSASESKTTSAAVASSHVDSSSSDAGKSLNMSSEAESDPFSNEGSSANETDGSEGSPQEVHSVTTDARGESTASIPLSPMDSCGGFTTPTYDGDSTGESNTTDSHQESDFEAKTTSAAAAVASSQVDSSLNLSSSDAETNFTSGEGATTRENASSEGSKPEMQSVTTDTLGETSASVPFSPMHSSEGFTSPTYNSDTASGSLTVDSPQLEGTALERRRCLSPGAENSVWTPTTCTTENELDDLSFVSDDSMGTTNSVLARLCKLEEKIAERQFDLKVLKLDVHQFEINAIRQSFDDEDRDEANLQGDAMDNISNTAEREGLDTRQ